jgi:hypothetical protein
MGLLPTKRSNYEADEKGGSGEFKRMLFCAVTRQVERIVHPVFNCVDMSGRMFLDVLDDLSGVLFEMICIFDECVASAGDGVFGHKGLSEERVFSRDENQALRLATLMEADGNRTILM